MKILPQLNSDELLAQGVCAVFLKNSRATGWLFSDEGHVLTVGHLFDTADPSEAIEIQFLDEQRRKVQMLYAVHYKQTAEDFAILKLEDPEGVNGRRPIPVAFVESAQGKWKLLGYGKTMAGQSAGRGEFLGPASVQNSSDDFFFKLDSKQTGEHGFSGSPVFSEDLQGVVAIQTEATTAQVGAESDTVLAVPLFRIAKRWTKFRSLAHDVAAGRNREAQRYQFPKKYLEYRIKASYKTLQEFGSEPAASVESPLGEEKYADTIRLYLKIYFVLCKRIGQPPDHAIAEIKKSLAGVDVEDDWSMDSLALAKLYTTLPGSRITVGVSQMFRIADLLTRPDSVKARQFYEAITNINKMRRTFDGRKSFRLGALGSLRPVTKKSAEHGSFWTPAIPNFRLPTVQPLCFLPYELSLSKHLQSVRLQSDNDSSLDHLAPFASIQSSQINGRLRIYPPGIGVISLGLTLEFKHEIAIELVSQVARNVEQLLFVGPGGEEPYDKLMPKIINRVIDSLFIDEGFSHENRGWTPPVTFFSFPEAAGLVPGEKTNELAYLMSLAPANYEKLQHLKARVRRALKTSRWRAQHILAVAGQDVALFFVDDRNSGTTKQSRNNLRLWLTETHELVAAAAYAQKAFAEEIDTFLAQRILDDSWLPQNPERFKYLKSLLETMQQVTRAIASIGADGGHLKNQGGALMTFAKDVWTYSNPVDYLKLQKGLTYIAEWLNQDSVNPPVEIVQLRRVIDSIMKMSPPFSQGIEQLQALSTKSAQEDLETDILSMFAELEEMLKEYEPEEFAETQHQEIMQRLRQQLGL